MTNRISDVYTRDVHPEPGSIHLALRPDNDNRSLFLVKGEHMRNMCDRSDASSSRWKVRGTPEQSAGDGVVLMFFLSEQAAITGSGKEDVVTLTKCTVVSG